MVQGFSRGMKRRLCIAIALMNKASALFLDEPTSGLDVQSVITIRNLVRRLNHQGLTVFLTTHNMEEANKICNRVAIINKGKIVAIDTPENLKRTIKKLQSIEVSFHGATRNLTKELEGLSGMIDIVKHGYKYRIYTENPPRVLSTIWNYAIANCLEIITVNTLGPSLEEYS